MDDVRVGKVTELFKDEGKIKVVYEDENNSSLKLSLLTFNGEYLMPKVGDRVVTIHMHSGSSKGFVLGSYYSDKKVPKANKGFRKDISETTYILVNDEDYMKIAGKDIELKADNDLKLSCSYATTTLEDLIKRIEVLEGIHNIE